MTAVADGEQTSSFRQVSLPLPSAAEGCANARAFVRGALGRWGVPVVTVADVEQVSSELVAHAFRVGARRVDLELVLDDEFVGVQVASKAMDPARDVTDEPDTADSPQLFIVGRLAADWWERAGPDGPVLGARVMVQDEPGW